MTSRPARRAIALAVASLALLGIIGVGLVFAASEWKLRRAHDLTPTPLHANAVPDPAEGERMAKILGCWAGCHGMKGEGDSMEMEGYYSVTAPTLSSVIPNYSD